MPAACASVMGGAVSLALWLRSGGCVRGLLRTIGRLLRGCARSRLRDRSASLRYAVAGIGAANKKPHRDWRNASSAFLSVGDSFEKRMVTAVASPLWRRM